jgi:hypothetical protein
MESNRLKILVPGTQHGSEQDQNPNHQYRAALVGDSLFPYQLMDQIRSVIHGVIEGMMSNQRM